MKTILITGCSSGFGKATAALFHERGWNVVATMRNPPGDLRESKGLRVVSLDVTRRASVDAAVRAAIDAFGAIDVVVNNAGIGLLSAFEDTPDKTIREIFETNTFGVMAVTQAAIPHMRERRGGTIINVTSSVTFVPMGLVSVYTASKTAIEGFTESLAYELSAFGVRAKLVEPGYAPTTAFTPNGAERMKGLLSQPYAPYAEQIFSGKLGEKMTRAEDVARVIWDAAADTSNRLRFAAGPDAEEMAEIRRKFPGDTYLEQVRGSLAPKA